MILLAFHGIGQDGITCFKPFEKNLGDYYTIYAFDLFFHGETTSLYQKRIVSEPDLITKEIWNGIIEAFLAKENIDRFDVTGFSMGGRFALATLEAFSDKIDKAFLIAPDGISEHPLYTLASRISPARRLFRWCMDYPKTFLQTTRLLKKAGLVNNSLYRFTQNVLNTSQKRNTIYNSWVAFRELRFNIPQLHKIVEAKEIEVHVFVGKYDKLLLPSAVKNLSELLPPTQYHLLMSGHSMLVEKVAVILSEKLIA